MDEFIKTRAFPWIVAVVAGIILFSCLGSFFEIRKITKSLKDSPEKSNQPFLLMSVPGEANPFQNNKNADESLLQEAEKFEAKEEPTVIEVKIQKEVK